MELQWFMDRAAGMVLALAIFALGWVISQGAHKAVIRASSARQFDKALAGFLANLGRYVILAAAVIAALDTVGVETTSLAALFASAGIAVGLALQGSLSSFASGVMLLVFRPFDIGEFVNVAGRAGTVSDIGLFATILTTPNNEMVVIPNSSITGDVITNFTRRGTRRGIVSVGVAYGSDVQKVSEVLLRAAAKPEMVQDDPVPAVRFVSMAASSLDFEVYTWCAAADYMAMLDAVTRSVYEELEAEGIEIPFQQVVIHRAPAEAEQAAAK